MKIGFDAKRAFHNTTGLGNYSRTLIQSLSTDFREHQYYLFNPKPGPCFSVQGENLHEILPVDPLSRLFPAWWRSSRMTRDIERLVDIYHGLSNELPYGIHRCKTKKIVTIHDLIFEFYPEQYASHDVAIYRKKFRYAATIADRVIATSESTRQDIAAVYGIDEQKISVCYQSCDERFFTCATAAQKQTVRERYGLSRPYFLSVGSLIERKNLLRICEALSLLPAGSVTDLVVIGKGKGPYVDAVRQLVQSKKMTSRVHFLEDQFPGESIYRDLPVLYQSAIALVYPSIKEGFGIPVLEAMASGIPVITSNQSSLPEVGGEAARYVDPTNAEAIAGEMRMIIQDAEWSAKLGRASLARASLFTNSRCAGQVMSVYQEINKTR